MPTEFRMPKLGESVVEGTISRWLKQPGERVARYEPLLEVQTDKVDTEVPAPVSGIVRELAVPEGATVKVGTLIAVLDDDEQDSMAAATSAFVTADAALPAELGSPGRPTANGARFVSPVVARMAAEHGLDLDVMSGTGIGGRVSKKDVEHFLESRRSNSSVNFPQPSASSQQASASPQQASMRPAEPSVSPQQASASSQQASVDASHGHAQQSTETELLPFSPMRRAIAEHMERSVRTAPHVTTVFEADVGRVLAHRERNRAEFERQGARLTLTPYFVQAVIAGLRATPLVNSTWTSEGIAQHRRAHIGVAVALEEGLIVPVLRDADDKSLLGLARAVSDVSERARAGRLQPGETQGGTFTLTNHGISGSLLATPIINQPQSAILGVGAIQKRTLVLTQNGIDSIAIRPMCFLSLSFDHRVIDGAIADAFLVAVKHFLESYAE